MARKSGATIEAGIVKKAGLSELAAALQGRIRAAQLALQNSISESQVLPEEVADLISERIKAQEEKYSNILPKDLTPEQQKFLDGQASKKNQPK